MGTISSILIVSFKWPSFFSIIFFFLSGRCCGSATNVITSSTPIRDRDGESLVSAQGAFELGFFTPGLPGPNRYLGIWFRKSSDKKVVWVANPNNPLTDSGILQIDEKSGLVLSDGEGNEVWSVAIESPHLSAELQDDGNFVVVDSMSSNNRSVLWQSFSHPSNTLLPGLELKRGRQKLRAWKNMSNPAGGDFWLELDPKGSDEFFLRQGSNIYWRSGHWDQKSSAFSNAVDLNPSFLFYFTLNTSKLTYYSSYNYTRLVLKYTGELQFYIWYEAGGRWILVWRVPERYCDIPASCGPNGACEGGPDVPCRCLRGLRPASTVDWEQGDYRGGCIRETPLACNNKDAFLPMSMWALPMNGTSVANVTEAGCKSECLDSCKCTAYSFDAANSTCTVWSEDLVGLNETYQPTTNSSVLNFSLRLAQPQRGNQRRCADCGNKVIPFPLSTSFDCGNPRLYSNIHCDNESELTITTISGRTSYRVTSVDARSRTLVIEAKSERPACWAGNNVNETEKRKIVKPDLNVNFPYHITNTTNIFMLHCTSVLPPAFWACDSSTPCQTYAEDVRCYSPKMCCSSRGGGQEFWHSYNSELPAELPCDSFATFTSRDFNSSRYLWTSGVEIGWGKADEEPLCGGQEDCQYWHNSSCSNTTTEDEKRCICDDNFRWDVSKQSCIQDAYGKSNASSEKLMHQNRRLGLIIGVNVALSLCVVAAVVLCFMRRMVLRKRTSRASNTAISLLRGDAGEDIDLPMLQFEVIVTSTGNFSPSNKLGQGGFGPVYKGQLPGGQEVAVKRLSQKSGQGVDEFKNELVLIAKLQHRNLVRLLGYCVEGDERILLYEYMPNRSLDFFLFDSDRSKHLGWKTRFNIILGITRGLLYLHQDSRLRIIHRDLKTSNILLDDEMNPKISDFGLARIFEGQEVEANTNRVVGTFGYISPEYASHGSFSIKSDVFSFGVILLEVITGQRNACFFHLQQQYSLLGHAWEIWKENKGLELVDEDIMEWNDEEEVLKCIQLGLLCVQEDPNDRPTMASVLGMLVNENASLAMPKKPAFFIPAQSSSGSQSSYAVLQSSSTDPRNISINKVTASMDLEGR